MLYEQGIGQPSIDLVGSDVTRAEPLKSATTIQNQCPPSICYGCLQKISALPGTIESLASGNFRF